MDGKNLIELLDKADECFDEVQEAFKTNYFLHKFVVTGPWVNDDFNAIEELDFSSVLDSTSISQNGAKENIKFVYLKSFNAVMSILKTFGHYITLLEIDFEDIDSNQGEKIVKFINDNGEKYFRLLSEFNLINCKDNVMNDLSYNFNRVFRMTFSSSKKYKLITKEHQKLSQFVPNLQHFFVTHATASDWRFIDSKFEYLNEFGLVFPKSKDENIINELNISSFFKNNPQIIKFNIENVTQKLLKEANDLLSNLNQLDIYGLSDDYLNYQDDFIHFNSTKKLTVAVKGLELLENVFFEALETFGLNIEPEFTSKWIDFIINQTNKHLHLFELKTINLKIEHFLAIPEKLPHTKSIFIQCKSTVTPNDIVYFVKTGKELMNLEMNINMTKQEQEKLKSDLPKDFTVEFKTIENEESVKIIIKR